MKQFIIFLILIYFTSAKKLTTRKGPKLEGNAKEVVTECARELAIDERNYEYGYDLDEYKRNPVETTTCMMACTTRKFMVQELTGPDNKATLYNGFSKLIEEAYKAGFGHENIQFTREDVVKKVENCYASAQGDCDFFKCIELYQQPLFELFIFDIIKSVAGSIFQLNLY